MLSYRLPWYYKENMHIQCQSNAVVADSQLTMVHGSISMQLLLVVLISIAVILFFSWSPRLVGCPNFLFVCFAYSEGVMSLSKFLLGRHGR